MTLFLEPRGKIWGNLFKYCKKLILSFLELQRADPNERKIETTMIVAETNFMKNGVVEE